MENKATPKYSEGMVSFMTTEHFTLQSARGIINQEISSRVSSYFMTLSSVLIATAFLAQLADHPMVFQLFSVVAFPILLMVGELTFIRIMQLGMVDRVYIRAINRVRHFYLEAAPEAEKYLLFPPYDDEISLNRYGGYRFTLFAHLLSAGGIVGAVNAILATILLGILLNNDFHMEIGQIVPIGLVTLVLLFPLQGMMAARIVRREIPDPHLEAQFPIPPFEVESAPQDSRRL
jgi:hypothetical protein